MSSNENPCLYYESEPFNKRSNRANNPNSRYAYVDPTFITTIAIIFLISLYVAGLWGNIGRAGELRTWLLPVEAEYIGMSDDGTSIVLQYADKKQETIPLEKLSPQDRLFVADENSKIRGKRDFVKDAKATVPFSQTYKDNENGFSFQIPEGCRPIDSAASTTYITLEDHGGSDFVRIVIRPEDENLLKTTREKIQKQWDKIVASDRHRRDTRPFEAHASPYTEEATVTDFGIHQFDGKDCLYYSIRAHITDGGIVRPLGGTRKTTVIQFPYKNKTFEVVIVGNSVDFGIAHPIVESLLSSFRFE